MELRSYNVMKVYHESVKCIIGNDLGIDKKLFQDNIVNIRSMLKQIKTVDGKAHLCACNKRTDGETWTPYLQIVEMIIRMGAKAGMVFWEGNLKATTVITIKTEL